MQRQLWFERKTGVRRALFVEMGAIVAGASPQVREALRKFGVAYGNTRQLSSDLGDLMGSEASRDLAAGRHTYPLAWYSSQLSPEEKKAFVQQLESARSNHQQQQDISHKLEQAGCFSRTTFALQCECRKALSALKETNLPPAQLEPLKVMLEDIAPAKFRDDMGIPPNLSLSVTQPTKLESTS